MAENINFYNFERYSGQAREVMALSMQQAQRFNHEYIGQEHILLALIMEGSGKGVEVLKNLNVDVRALRLRVEKKLQSAHDIVTMGKLPQTSGAKHVVEEALKVAQELGSPTVDTEHLLYGLFVLPSKGEKNLAREALLSFEGVTQESVKAKMIKLFGYIKIGGATPRLTASVEGDTVILVHNGSKLSITAELLGFLYDSGLESVDGVSKVDHLELVYVLLKDLRDKR